MNFSPTPNMIAEKAGPIGRLVFNKPQKHNATSTDMWEAIPVILDEFEKDPAIRVVVVTGAGDKAFVSGADVSAIRARRRDDALAGINSRLMSAVESHEAVTIAAVNGYALGGGCELALACDLRIAADNAVFGLPEPTLGIIPGAGGTQRLPRVVGLGRAKEMILTGARWDAARALEVGLVSAVVPPADLARTAREWADRVLSLGPLAVRLAKASLNASSQMPLAAGLAYESAVQAITFESQDKHEGTTAFLEKRKPQFRGE